uniref:G_PROTEIN_RECEP_F1_2 domain-containing protein n=1 Tax=Echinostoma caproni TaxID=27848 RepID=A0A183ALW8_9TREM
LSSTSTYVSITPITPARKSVAGCPVNPVPLLRVLESSNQDLSTCEPQPGANNNDNNDSSSPEPIKASQTHLLVVPDLDCMEKPRKQFGLDVPKSGLAQRRCSTPLLSLNNGGAKSFDPIPMREPDLRKQSFATPQMRRKSSNDVFASLFHGRTSEPSAPGRAGEEPLLLQMLRRQHHRTLRILIILLLVFVVCRAPRAIILMIGWLQSHCLCVSPTQAYAWLHYASLWSHTSAVFDTIVYGFWGNRTYRTRLRHWYSKCITCTKHE